MLCNTVYNRRLLFVFQTGCVNQRISKRQIGRILWFQAELNVTQLWPSLMFGTRPQNQTTIHVIYRPMNCYLVVQKPPLNYAVCVLVEPLFKDNTLCVQGVLILWRRDNALLIIYLFNSITCIKSITTGLVVPVSTHTQTKSICLTVCLYVCLSGCLADLLAGWPAVCPSVTLSLSLSDIYIPKRWTMDIYNRRENTLLMLTTKHKTTPALLPLHSFLLHNSHFSSSKADILKWNMVIIIITKPFHI